MLFAGAGLPLTACSPWENYSLNVLLEITAETESGRVTGDAVLHTGFYYNALQFDQIREYARKVTGDAVVLSFSRGTYLFGLLQPPAGLSGFAAGQIYEVLTRYLPRQSEGGNIYKRLETLKGKFQLSKETWPVMARFENINEPATLEIVDSSNLPSEYGVDAHIESVTIEVTDRPVTVKVESILPWLAEVRKRRYGKLMDTEASYGTAAYRTTYRSFELRGDEL
jgi:hypothetical protein